MSMISIELRDSYRETYLSLSLWQNDHKNLNWETESEFELYQILNELASEYELWFWVDEVTDRPMLWYHKSFYKAEEEKERIVLISLNTNDKLMY